MKHKIQIVSDKARSGLLFEDYEAAEAAGFKRGERVGGHQLRDELVGKPCLVGLHGPMWGGWRDANGKHVFFACGSRDGPDGEVAAYSPSKGPIDHYLVRYEDQESYEVLSR